MAFSKVVIHFIFVKPTYPDHTVTITQGIGGQLNPIRFISL